MQKLNININQNLNTMQIINTFESDKGKSLSLEATNILSYLAEKVIETDECIPSFIINDVPGYNIFWLKDHQDRDIKTWTKIQLVTYTKAELYALK